MNSNLCTFIAFIEISGMQLSHLIFGPAFNDSTKWISSKFSQPTDQISCRKLDFKGSKTNDERKCHRWKETDFFPYEMNIIP